MANKLEFELLNDEQMDDHLMQLQEWDIENGALEKTYTHGTFMEGIEFVNQVARLAEELSHHPDFIINFKKVKLRIWTHKMKAITKADFQLAAEIDKMVGLL